MSGWLRFLAVLLAVIAVWLVIRQVGIFGYRPFGTPRERPPGPPVAGARGRLAYVRSGDLFVFDLRDGSERRLTQTGGVRSPRWSGGGTWLAYERDGRLVAMRADGTSTIDLPGGDVPASGIWSPTGARIAYASTDGSLSIYEPISRSNPRRVVVPAGSGVGGNIAWTHDGIRLAYERHERAGANVSNEGIWNVLESGRNPTPVFLASGDVRLTLCCWTASAAVVLFWQSGGAVNLAEGAPLYVARATSSQPALVVEQMLAERSWVDRAPRSDGLALITGGQALTGGRRLMVALPRNLPDGRLGVDTSLVEGANAPTDPAWAPLPNESAVVAYSAGRRIWLARPDGSQKRALLADATVPAAVSDERPLWPRDARTLVFARRLKPDTRPVPDALELWVANFDGTQSRRVAGGLTDPGTGPDGRVDWAAVFDYYRG